MKILLAIPHTWNIRAELVQFLLSLNNYWHDVKIFLSWWRPITANRNIILNAFKEWGFDYLLTIDSDILPPDNILEMLDNKVDICSADIYTAKWNEVIRLWLEKVKEWYKAKELIEWLNEVDATWTGCLLLSKKIIEEVWEFKWDNEDFNFCERAKEKWYTIYYDTRYRCKHFQIYPI
jgi:choline kinase